MHSFSIQRRTKQERRHWPHSLAISNTYSKTKYWVNLIFRSKILSKINGALQQFCSLIPRTWTKFQISLIKIMLTKYIEVLGFLAHIYPSYMNDPLRKEMVICISTVQAILLFSVTWNFNIFFLKYYSWMQSDILN